MNSVFRRIAVSDLRKGRFAFAGLVLACVGLAAGGCGEGSSKKTSSCASGGEDCACGSGNECDSGLECLSGKCVSVGSGDAASDGAVEQSDDASSADAGDDTADGSADTNGSGEDAGAGQDAGPGTDTGTGGDAGTDGAADASADASGGPSLTDFCTQYADKSCTWAKACRGWTDCSNIDFRKAACEAVVKEVQAGRISYSPAQAQACLDTIRTDTCGFFYDRSVCAKAFLGKQAASDPCYNSFASGPGFSFFPFGNECKNGYCAPDSGCDCVAYAGVDDACPTGSECDPKTAYCGGDHTCHAYVAPNGDCSSGSCQPGYGCVTLADAQKCLAGGVEPGGDCQGTPQCLNGDVCLAGKCVATVGSGDPCVGFFNCPSGTTCVGNTGGPMPDAKCTPYAQVDESCASAQCDPALHLFCDMSQKCVAEPNIGETCTPFGVPCVDGWCSNATYKCRPIGQQGDDCGDNDDHPVDSQRCQAGLFCVPTGLDSQNQATGWQCTSAGVKGDLCHNDDSCQANLWCDVNGTRACSDLLGEGQSGCYGDDAACQPGLFCGGVAPSNCTTKYANGHDCGYNDECVSDFCDIGPSAATGTCAAMPPPTPSPNLCVSPEI